MKKNLYLGLCLLLTLGFCVPKALAQTSPYSIGTTTLEYAGCDSLNYRLGISPASPLDSFLYAATSFGDGTTAIDTVLKNLPARLYVHHQYTEPGVYTVKSILYDADTAVDSIVFIDTVNLCSTLHVLSYIDKTGDCKFDSGDTYMPNPYTVEVDSAGIPVDTITSTSFYYAIEGSTGSATIYAFKILTLPSGYMLSCPGDSIVYDTVSTTSPSAWYATFGFVCDSSSSDPHIWGWFSPGLTGACSHVYAYEYGCATIPEATITIYYSTQYVYDSTSTGLTPSSSGAGWVTFLTGAMAPDSVISFIAYFTADSSVAIGATTYTTWTVNAITGDSATHSEIDTIRSSYDPNEKSVSPQGNIHAGTQLQYAIGFENTGNDTAFNIHIQDTLSANLDIKTFKLASASSHVITEISTDAAGQNVVDFTLPNINLLYPGHGQNTGMVIFTINAKSGLSNGTVINNRAGIYFDYNPVVMTNTTVNVIGTPAGIATLSNAGNVEIYPNPVTDLLTINATNSSYNTVTIFSTVGQTVYHGQISNNQFPLTMGVKALPAGIYYVNLQGDSGVTVQKFVKE